METIETGLDNEARMVQEKPMTKQEESLNTGLDFEREFKKLSSNWFIPVIAASLVAFAFMMLIISGDWHGFQQARNALHVVFWLMVGAMFLISLSKIKESDKGYEHVLKIPLEVVAAGTLIAWLSAGNRHNHLVSFLGVLFVALCLLGYFITYVKDIFHCQDGTFRKQLLWVRFYQRYLKVRLERKQTFKLFMAIFIQPILLFLVVVTAIALWHFNVAMLILWGIVYLFLLFFYLRYKMSQIQKDYVKVHQMARNISLGNQAQMVDEDLGVFNGLKDELEHIQDGVAKAVERAVASERMKGELITNVSHDLKTPLTSIITYVDLLQVDDLDDEKKQQYLNTLVVKTERLKTLVEDLFEVSKAATGNITIDLMEVDVVTLIKQTLLGLEDRIVDSGLILREGYPEEKVLLTLDGGRMHRVFENLIINMVKYAMPGTRAYIDILDNGSQVDVILRNISAHELNVDMNDLAERFVRGDAARNTDGSGLGLAIAKSFVELQGGTFKIAVDGDLFKVMMIFKKRVSDN